MNSCRLYLFFLLQTLAFPALAMEADWLIVSRSENIAAGQDIELQVIRPADTSAWPETLELRLISGNGSESRIALQPDTDTSSDTMRRAYSGKLSVPLQGVVRAELANMPSNRLALVAEEPQTSDQPSPSTSEAVAASHQEEETATQADMGEDNRLPALTVNEPMYFLLGKDGEARFQLSFKYRIFSPESSTVELAPFRRGLYFAYTQNSFWELGEDSKPFRDTSYRPSLFWQDRITGPAWFPQTWKAGFEHESNGKDGEDSRSMNTLFFEPRWQYEFADGSLLSFNPRIRSYIEKKENPDIQHYRGYVNWRAQYGWEDSWKFALNYVQGTEGYAAAQLDASYPIGTNIFSNIGSFIHFQYFSGYGETLLEYNKRKSDQFRIGISIVR
ncbi:MAG: phospholipase A [Methylobacillus sp.]|jgi:outer membrane phospholipase A|nr:phospholipase A [Methylobacillus sp.]